MGGLCFSVGSREAPRRGGSPTTLHFCGEPANSSCSWLTRALGKVAPRSRGELIASSLASLGATEESCDFSHEQRGPSGAGPLLFGRRSPSSLRAVASVVFACWARGRSQLALRLLVSKWLHPTRLETRTKECNMRASLGVANPSAQ